MRLKHVCSLYGDYGLNISAEEYVDDGVPIIRTSDFDDFGRLDLTEPKRVSASAASAKMLRRGDILFSRAGTIGRCTTYNHDNPATFAAYLVRFRPTASLVEPRFIGWWAQSQQYWSQIRADTIESTIGNFNAGKLGNLALPRVPRENQKAIADFLDSETARIDQLIEKRSKFAQLLLERRLAVISKAITGSTYDASWLEALPQDWKAERAKLHFRENQKRSETGEEELLTVSHITGVTKRSDKDVNMFMAESNEGYKLVNPGDLIINTMWAWMGAMGVSSEQGLISPSYGVYTPISDALRPAFIDLMVRSKPFVAEATRRSKGIHSSRLRFYPDAFLDMRLPIPPLDTQDAMLGDVSSRLQREDELLRKNARAETLLREFRSALITAAVTGQIDVTTWGKQGQTDRRLDEIEEAMRA